MSDNNEERELKSFVYNQVPKDPKTPKRTRVSDSPEERMENLINSLKEIRPLISPIEVSVVQQDADLLRKIVKYKQHDKCFEITKVEQDGKN